MADKKGGGRASKFMKTVNRASRISQETPLTEDVVEEQEEQVEPATQAVDSVPATDGASGSGEASGEEERPAEQQPARRTPRNTGKGRRTRTKQRSRPEKPVRITVDLDAERHRFLRDYAFREETKGTAVIRALLDELQEDPGLSDRVGERLLDPDTA